MKQSRKENERKINSSMMINPIRYYIFEQFVLRNGNNTWIFQHTGFRVIFRRWSWLLRHWLHSTAGRRWRGRGGTSAIRIKKAASYRGQFSMGQWDGGAVIKRYNEIYRPLVNRFERRSLFHLGLLWTPKKRFRQFFHEFSLVVAPRRYD